MELEFIVSFPDFKINLALKTKYSEELHSLSISFFSWGGRSKTYKNREIVLIQLIGLFAYSIC